MANNNDAGVIIHFNRLPELIDAYPDAVARGIAATAFEGERIVKQSISDSPATGNRYGRHVASSPGNPPRIDTSNLVNNINTHQYNRFSWAIRSGAIYSMELEYGTTRMEARPFMGPMAMEIQNQADDILRGFMQDVI